MNKFPSTSFCPMRWTRQRGQVLYLSLAAIVFLSLMTFATYNISQMTHAKMQTMNASDAGAYAMATVVARDLNFMAYTNRAMAANHAVVGQLVSLASLSEMIYLAADDLSILQYFPIPILSQVGKAFETLAQTIDKEVLPFLETLTKAEDGLIQLISASQPIAHGITALDAEQIVDKVIKANDPELKWAADLTGGIASGNNIMSFIGFSERRNDNDAYAHMTEVVNVSRDGFTVKRAWVPIPNLLFPLRRVSKTVFHGGTQLSSDNKTWVGVDGLDIQYELCCDKWGRWKPKEFKYWLTGEVAGSSDADDWQQLSHGELSRGAHQQAYSNRKHRLENSYSGILPYQELKGEPKVGEHPTPAFVVLVYKPVRSATTPNATQTFGTDVGNTFHLEEGRAKIYGVAAAHAYFRRPTKNEKDPTAGKLPNEYYANGTYATLFSPYWQPRLTDIPAGVAAALATAGN